jgi:hypothetical protein
MNDHDPEQHSEQHPDGIDPDDARRAERLRDVLGADEAVDDVPMSPYDLAYVEMQARGRRQRKVAGLALAAALVVFVAGSALALGRNGRTDDGEVAGSHGSTLGTSTAVVPTSSQLDGTTTMPSGTSGVLCGVLSVPSDTAPTCGPTSTAESSTSELPSSSSSSGGPSTTAPPTTYPPPTSAATPTTPTTVPIGGDCGSWSPVGWPTTFPPSRTLASCLIGAFDAGVPATLRIEIYRTGDPNQPVTTTYEVIGLHKVRVTIDSGQSKVPPQTLEIEECTSLTADGYNSNVVAVSGCVQIIGHD